MSKKAIKKVTSAFTLGASSMLLGDDQAEKAARDAARQQEQQARMQAQQAQEAAAQAAKQQELMAQREQVQQAANEQAAQQQVERPTIELAVDVQPIQSKRKRFQGQSTGGAGGASLRV